MMDELKLKLSTKFMKGIVAKLLARFIKQKTGYKVNIQLDDLDILVLDGDVAVKVNAEVRMKSEEFKKIMTGIEMD